MSVEQSWPQTEQHKRGAFSSRRVFILAAIGSAVGLGNIWRFPYVAYDNGGGSFIIPYLVALLTAGIPFLLLDYALGHRYRGSAPLSFARLRRGTEGLGWWQVAICFVIAVYYAAVLAWAVSYTVFSVDKAWGAEPDAFFFGEYLQAGDPGVTASVVPGVLVPLIVVWAGVALIMLLGVQRGIGITSAIFIPLLVIAFLILVVRALMLPGAAEGLDALFTPNWAALAEPGVWAAAFGQIFFSLSIGFGIMITYASYVDRETDMTGSGLVVGFANSSFEVLAGIGLAFVAFPAIINEVPGGALIGVLFFGSLVVAGLTSLVSVIEVVISGVRDKFDLSRRVATAAVIAPAAVLSLVFFSTTSGIYVLDIVDHFVNRFGILLVAVVSVLVVAWAVRALPRLAEHLNRTADIRVGRLWVVTLGFFVPLALGAVLVQELWAVIDEPYGGYPGWMLVVFGWLMVVAIAVAGFVAARVPWREGTSLADPSVPDSEEIS